MLYFDIKISQDSEQERTEIVQTIYLRLDSEQERTEIVQTIYLRLFISTNEEWLCCEALVLRIGIGNLNKAVVQIWAVTVGLVFGFARDNFYSQMCHLDLPKQSHKSQVTSHTASPKIKIQNNKHYEQSFVSFSLIPSNSNLHVYLC